MMERDQLDPFRKLIAKGMVQDGLALFEEIVKENPAFTSGPLAAQFLPALMVTCVGGVFHTRLMERLSVTAFMILDKENKDV